MPGTTFSLREFDILWSAQQLGPFPFPLQVPSHGQTIEERDEIRAAVFERLADRGLASGHRLDPEWADLLTTLARPAESVDAVGQVERPLAALAARANGIGALAMLDGNSVVLGPIRPEAMVASVVGLLPARPAGPGHRVAVAVDAVQRYLNGGRAGDGYEDELDDDPLAGGGHQRGERQALTEAGLRSEDAGLLLALADGRVRGGQFGVNAADEPGGRLRRGAPVVCWFDTAQGRYVMTNDGDLLTIAPADAAGIGAWINQALSALG